MQWAIYIFRDVHAKKDCQLPFMHVLCFPFLPLDFKLCKKLHGLLVYCLLELEKDRSTQTYQTVISVAMIKCAILTFGNPDIITSGTCQNKETDLPLQGPPPPHPTASHPSSAVSSSPLSVWSTQCQKNDTVTKH